MTLYKIVIIIHEITKNMTFNIYSNIYFAIQIVRLKNIFFYMNCRMSFF